ncbi:MAG: DNA mismatch endonuclease Vsr [Maritimibacter sp.]|nr:DNA mismatch endonuclease Vsr [Maritimibacter sp.]
MADIVSPEVRSRMMSRIRGRDTKPEIALRKALFRRGFRYRLNDRRLPGSPDIVFPKYGAAVLVHGCYWHRHPGCPKAYTPKSRVEFWQSKFDENVARDMRNLERLRAAGWRVAIIWECSVGTEPPVALVDRIETFLKSDDPMMELPE